MHLCESLRSVERWSPAELSQIVEAEGAGGPFLVWRTPEGTMGLCPLRDRTRVTIGRRSTNDVPLGGDGEVSRLHAVLERLGEDWTLVDDGLSRNGTFVNGEALHSRHRLMDGDLVRLGGTVIEYHQPGGITTPLTSPGQEVAAAELLNETQRRILAALCRPYRSVNQHPRPATNVEIGREVFLGIDAVKSHLRQLYRRFGLSELPQNQKRAQLAALALRSGIAPGPELKVAPALDDDRDAV